MTIGTPVRGLWLIAALAAGWAMAKPPAEAASRDHATALNEEVVRELVDTARFAKEAVPGQGDAAYTRYQAAHELVDGGHFDKALPEYLWAWTHTTVATPGWGVLRYSFFLRDLGELVRAYPPAWETFAHVRDAAELQIQAGQLAPLDDWLALNRALGNAALSLQWFDGAAKHPPAGLDFARLQRWLEGPLKARGRWADLARLYPDPMRALEGQQSVVQSVLWLARKMESYKEPEARESAVKVREVANAMLPEFAGDLVRSLVAAGRKAEVEKVAARAKELDASAAMAKALAEGAAGR